MENHLFICTNNDLDIKFERFHLGLWEFKNKSCLLEIGGEIENTSISSKAEITVDFFIPWYNKHCVPTDYYTRLKEKNNIRFIFNDNVTNTITLFDDKLGNKEVGTIYEFPDRNILCLVPLTINSHYSDNRITIKINLEEYHKKKLSHNIYFRFAIEPNQSFISLRKNGISKTSIIYDLKINEKRNIPVHLLDKLISKNFCKIKTCFQFNIVPNSFELSFFEASSLKNVRTLEYQGFSNYIKDKRVKKDELLVVFNKKKDLDSYSFFSIFHKELVGVGQFALAVMTNLICGILLFIPAYRDSKGGSINLLNLPLEIYIAIFIWLSMLIYLGKGYLIKLLEFIKLKLISKN